MRNPKRFMVYVIALDLGVLSSKKFREDNPNYREGSPCYYVGMTSSAPEVRYEQHKSGYKACRYARDFGIELMPARFAQCNPKTYDDALRHERKVAKRLKAKGYGVWQR